MPRIARILTAVASAALLGLFLAPLWRINLTAPQYPEGLGMLIGVSSIRGVSPNDLNNINGLNHYIGMKVITPEAIPELRIIPWVVAGLAAVGFLVAAIGRRTMLSVWLACFAFVGAGGLADFWKWEYDYGHNIDYAHAIIKIPGMNYQPPLIGVKQLLNFTAVSWPDVGGWLAGIAFLLGTAAVVIAWSRKSALAV